MSKAVAITTPGSITIKNHQVFVTYGVKTTDKNRVVLAKDLKAAQLAIAQVDGVDAEEVELWIADAVIVVKEDE